MTDAKSDKIREKLDRQMEAQCTAVKMWQDAAPGRECTIPHPWELSEFLLARLDKTRVALKVAISYLDDEYDPALAVLAARLARLRRAL